MDKISPSDYQIIIIGASIAGLASALSLHKQGFRVIVYERTEEFRRGGAGVGLDAPTIEYLTKLGVDTSSLVWQMSIEENRDQNSRVLYRDENYNYYSAYWRCLYASLLKALPEDLVRFHHNCVEVIQYQDKLSENGKVRVMVKPRDGEEFGVVGDVVLGADGIQSMVREYLRGKEKMVYSGYLAWRGYIDTKDPKTHNFPNEEALQEFLKELRSEYSDLGRCLYFELHDSGTSNVLYMLPGGFVNWLWYRKEENITRETITFNPTMEETEAMKHDSKSVWGKNFTRLIDVTAAPFVNYIYDRDPIDKFVYGNIALIGDAAHAARPHRLQASSMAIKDAWVLGQCLGENREDLLKGLKKYEEMRVKETANIVLFSRYLGDLKQGLMFPELKWSESTAEDNGLVAQNRLSTWK